MRRLFVALRPPANVRAALLAIMGGVEGVRWQDDSQLHLSLAFIGDCNIHEQTIAADALSSIKAPALTLGLGHVGGFAAARPDRLSVLWVAVADASEAGQPRRRRGALFALAGAVRQQLRRSGLPLDERRFFPHITLARGPRSGVPRAAVRRWLAIAHLPATSWTASRFYLVESHLGGEGSSYAPVAAFPLGVQP